MKIAVIILSVVVVLELVLGGLAIYNLTNQNNNLTAEKNKLTLINTNLTEDNSQVYKNYNALKSKYPLKNFGSVAELRSWTEAHYRDPNNWGFIPAGTVIPGMGTLNYDLTIPAYVRRRQAGYDASPPYIIPEYNYLVRYLNPQSGPPLVTNALTINKAYRTALEIQWEAEKDGYVMWVNFDPVSDTDFSQGVYITLFTLVNNSPPVSGQIYYWEYDTVFVYPLGVNLQ